MPWFSWLCLSSIQSPRAPPEELEDDQILPIDKKVRLTAVHAEPGSDVCHVMPLRKKKKKKNSIKLFYFSVNLSLQPFILSSLGLFGLCGIRLREPMADWGRRDLGGGQQQEFDGQGRGLCCHRGRSGSGGGARSHARNGANLQVAHEKRRLVHSGPAEGSKYVLASATPDQTKLFSCM